MDTYQKVMFVRDKLTEEDKEAFCNAEQVLNRTVYDLYSFETEYYEIEREGLDFCSNTKRQELDKPMAALKTLREIALKHGIVFPSIEDEYAFSAWLSNNYGRSLLRHK